VARSYKHGNETMYSVKGPGEGGGRVFLDQFHFSITIISHGITVEPGYNDIGKGDTSSIASDILWYQLIRHH
jgi:hypothetical protein